MIVDDFIGTGTTAKDFIEAYEEKLKSENSNFFFITIACLTSGLKQIRDLGSEIYYSICQGRGISDSTRFQDYALALNLIDRIENRIDISADYLRGFLQSEALISLIRTPNNTFPAYWATRQKGGEKWPSPFPR